MDEPDDHISRDDAELLVQQTASDTASWMLSFVFTPHGLPPIKSFRRFVALVYILRPDLLDGANMRELAASLAVGKTTFQRYVEQVRREIEVDGRFKRHG